MSSDAEEPITVAVVSHEFEASVIVSALEEQGIRARAVGGYIADFRAPTSAGVAIVVAESDLPRAKQVVEDLRRHRGDVDWSQVDVEHPEEGERPV